MTQERAPRLSPAHHSELRALVALLDSRRRTASAVVGEVRALGYIQVKRLADVYQLLADHGSFDAGPPTRSELTSDDVNFVRQALARRMNNKAAKILGALRARGVDARSMAHVHEMLARNRG